MAEKSAATRFQRTGAANFGGRRFRLVPPAITPLRASDIPAGMAGQLRGTGRDTFRETVRASLEADSVGTYTSFRRALAACLGTLADSSEDSTVAVPAFCSADYPAVVDGLGLKEQRYDINGKTLSADLDAIESLPLDDMLALVVVNVLGYGSRMDEIATLCADHDVYLVEALGYGLGAEYDGRPLGTYGDCSVLNFQQGKPIPVGGGMVVSQNPSLAFDDERPPVAANPATLGGYALFSRPRAYFWYSVALQRATRALGADERVSTHPETKEGVEYDEQFRTLSNFQGTVADRVFHRLEDHRHQRSRTAQYYASALSDVPGIEHIEAVEGLTSHQYVRYPLVVDASIREQLREQLADNGIQATTLYDWPAIDSDAYPDAARLQQGILTLPTHPYVDARDRERTARIVRNVGAD